MIVAIRPVLAAVSLLCLAAPAFAQSENKFAIGAQLSAKRGQNPSARGDSGIGLLWRLGHSRTGWGWRWGLNWYAADIDRAIGGTNTELGRLRIRPFMGGYGYTHVVGRTAVTAGVLGGYALTSFELTPLADDAYRQRLGAQSVSAEAANAFVVKPDVAIWIDVSRKIGIHINTGYMIARPSVTINSTLGDDTTRVRADMFMFKVGAVYSVF